MKPVVGLGVERLVDARDHELQRGVFEDVADGESELFGRARRQRDLDGRLRRLLNGGLLVSVPGDRCRPFDEGNARAPLKVDGQGEHGMRDG